MPWTPEDNLIIACCRKALDISANHDDYPEMNKINWNTFLLKAKEEGVGQLVYHSIKKDLQIGATPVPGKIRRALEAEYYSTATRNTFLLQELGQTAKALHEAGIAAMVMKGAHLAEWVYKNPALRPMSDIDLLIKKGDLAAVARVFNALGYSSQDIKTIDPEALPVDYLTTVVFTSPRKRTANFHIHWHFINSTLPNDSLIKGINMDIVWKEAEPVTICGAHILVMAPHHLLIHLAEHSLRVTHSLARLGYLCDLAVVVKTYGQRIDWARLVADGKQFNIPLLLYFPLLYARNLLGAAIPDTVLAGLRPDSFGMLANIFSRLFESNHRFPGASYLLHLAQTQTLAARMHFVARTVFPPRHVLAQRFAIAPGKVNVLYYCKRFLEVFLSGFRTVLSLLRSEKKQSD